MDKLSSSFDKPIILCIALHDNTSTATFRNINIHMKNINDKYSTCYTNREFIDNYIFIKNCDLDKLSRPPDEKFANKLSTYHIPLMGDVIIPIKKQDTVDVPSSPPSDIKPSYTQLLQQQQQQQGSSKDSVNKTIQTNPEVNQIQNNNPSHDDTLPSLLSPSTPSSQQTQLQSNSVQAMSGSNQTQIPKQIQTTYLPPSNSYPHPPNNYPPPNSYPPQSHFQPPINYPPPNTYPPPPLYPSNYPLSNYPPPPPNYPQSSYPPNSYSQPSFISQSRYPYNVSYHPPPSALPPPPYYQQNQPPPYNINQNIHQSQNNNQFQQNQYTNPNNSTMPQPPSQPNQYIQRSDYSIPPQYQNNQPNHNYINTYPPHQPISVYPNNYQIQSQPNQNNQQNQSFFSDQENNNIEKQNNQQYQSNQNNVSQPNFYPNQRIVIK